MRRLLLIAVLALGASSARATDYFVATNGSDAADGLSVTSAWQSIQQSANRILGGDRLWVRGGVYRGLVNFTNNSGSAGAPIAVCAWSNESPILRGSVVETNWQFVSGNMWRVAAWTNTTQQVFVDGRLLQQLGWPNGLMSNRTCSCFDFLYIPYGFSCGDINPATLQIQIGDPKTNMPANSFYVDALTTSLYVNVTNTFNPPSSQIEVSKYAGTWNDQSSVGWLQLKGLTFQHADTVTYVVDGFPAVVLGFNGLMEDCVIEWGDGAGLTIRNNTTVRRCTIRNNGVQGVHCNSHTNMVIEDSTIVSNGYRAYNYSQSGALRFIPNAGATVRRCEVAWNNEIGIWFDTCRAGHPLVIEGNYVHDNKPFPNRPGDPGYYTTAGIFIEVSSRAKVFNNILVSNAINGLMVGGSYDCEVFNNVITGTRGVAGGTRGLAALAQAWYHQDLLTASNRFYNNVIYDNETDMDLNLAPDDGEFVHGNYFDHNLFYRSQAAGIICSTCTAVIVVGGNIYRSFSAYQAGTGFDGHGTNVAPMLSAAWRPQAGSPCIDAGQLGSPITMDRAGIPRPLDGDGNNRAAVDLGAYEFTNATAQVRYVDAGSTNPVSPFASRATAARQIQAAVDAAAAGDLVIVAGGVYSGGVSVAKGIAVVGESGPGGTTIDGEGLARCLVASHSNAIVDGFTFTRGAALDGAGLRLENGAAAQNCWSISNSAAGDGGGVFVAGGSLFRDGRAMDNVAGGAGGGLYVTGSATIQRCDVLRNRAQDGGGIYASGPAQLDHLTAIANSASNRAGGVFLSGGSYLDAGVVSANSASVSGGGLFLQSGSTANACRVSGNESSGDGGGGAGEAASLFQTCLVYDNRAGNQAGGLQLAGSAAARFCTIAINRATNQAGGVYGAAGTLVQNCVVFLNSASASSNYAGNVTFDHACTFPLPVGPGNIEDHPKFMDDISRDLRLRNDSPCVDAGTGATDLDFDGGVRVLDGDGDHVAQIDIGAYESRAYHFVLAGGTNAVFPYRDWSTAAADIQSAINFARNGDVILVGDGTYGAGVNIYRMVKVKSVNGPAATVINGQNAARCLFMAHPLGELEGFTLANGRADAGAGVYFNGGGIVRRCILRGNEAFGNLGGALSYQTVFPDYYYCGKGLESFVHEGGGAAMLHRGGLLENCLLVSNRASYGAGAATVDGGVIQNCALVGNIATNGGGVYARNGGLIRNSIAYGNTAVAGTNYIVSGTGVIFASTCAAPVPPGAGNIAANPLLAAGFKLSAGSPCVDAGDPAGAPAQDFDGIPRPLDGDAAGGAAFDVGAFEYAATNVDSDADGLSDAAEVTNGTHILNADTDGDRMRDGDEIIAGTLPTNAASYFALTETPPAVSGSFVVRWSSATGRLYYLQRATNLLQSFDPWVSNIAAVPPMNAWTDGPTAGAQRFYRVGVQP